MERKKKGKNEPKTHTRVGDSWGTSSCSQFKPSILGNRRFDSRLLHRASLSKYSLLLLLLCLLLLVHHLLISLLSAGARTCLQEKREITTAKHSRRDLASRDINILLLVSDHVEEIFTDLPAVTHRYRVRDTWNVINRARQWKIFGFSLPCEVKTLWGHSTDFYSAGLGFRWSERESIDSTNLRWWVTNYFTNACKAYFFPSENRCYFFIGFLWKWNFISHNSFLL